MSGKMTCTVDYDCNLVVTIPEIYDALKFMDVESRQRLACYMACDDDLFGKIVGVLADGFCSPSEDDWRWWSPSVEKEARALLDSKLGDVAERRIEDLKREIAAKDADIARAEEWQNLYRTALSRYVGGWSEAHLAALNVRDEKARAAQS